MTFRDDESHTRDRHLCENLAWLPRFALATAQKTPQHQNQSRHETPTNRMVCLVPLRNTLQFNDFVGAGPEPTLSEGDLVVMDNLSAHKVSGIREAIMAVGATRVYLPPPSPDLNPIERVFSKLKWLVCSESLRTIERLWAFLRQTLDRFRPDECLRYF